MQYGAVFDPPPDHTFWGARWHQTREHTVPLLLERLEAHGAIDNLRDLSTARQGWWFADSDVHKWLEAAVKVDRLDLAEPVAEIIAAAQAPDGYLHSFFGERRYERLDGSHELYCMGHFIEAACAHHDRTGSTWLLDVAVRAADHIVREFGPGGDHEGATDGHPEIELALCALSHRTGDRRYAAQARRFVHSLPDALHRPSGHAVRALYFATGAWDAAQLLDDDELAGEVRRWWTELVETRMYVTGGVGGRWVSESIGRPYELPNEMAYSETCAAVAAARLANRLGDTLTERRIVHNALLAGVNQAGDAWFYSSPLAATHGDEVNPWQVGRDFSAGSLVERFPARRLPWYDVTCCPTNLTRWMAALPDWHGVSDDPVAEARAAHPVVVHGHPRNEATRGCVAVELGPFVMCAEEVDIPELAVSSVGILAIDATVDSPLHSPLDELAGPLPRVEVTAADLHWEGPSFGGREVVGEPRSVPLVPYFAWANRSVGAMTVWFRNLGNVH